MFKMSLTTTLLGIATISAYAQSSGPLQAEVPFAFIVQDTRLPAGNYQMTYNSSAQRLLIRGLGQSSKGVFATAAPVTASESSNAATELIFECYKNNCYLEQVSQAGINGSEGWKVLQSKEERRIALLTHAASITIPSR